MGLERWLNLLGNNSCMILQVNKRFFKKLSSCQSISHFLSCTTWVDKFISAIMELKGLWNAFEWYLKVKLCFRNRGKTSFQLALLQFSKSQFVTTIDDSTHYLDNKTFKEVSGCKTFYFFLSREKDCYKNASIAHKSRTTKWKYNLII